MPCAAASRTTGTRTSSAARTGQAARRGAETRRLAVHARTPPPPGWARCRDRGPGRRQRRALYSTPRLDVNHRSATYGGRTLLGIAAQLSRRCARRAPVKTFDADVDARDDEGWSPLAEAAFRGNEALACVFRNRARRATRGAEAGTPSCDPHSHAG